MGFVKVWAVNFNQANKFPLREEALFWMNQFPAGLLPRRGGRAGRRWPAARMQEPANPSDPVQLVHKCHFTRHWCFTLPLPTCVHKGPPSARTTVHRDTGKRSWERLREPIQAGGGRSQGADTRLCPPQASGKSLLWRPGFSSSEREHQRTHWENTGEGLVGRRLVFPLLMLESCWGRGSFFS